MHVVCGDLERALISDGLKLHNNLRVSSISCNPLPLWSPLIILSARGETARMRPNSSSKLGNSISTPSVLEGICFLKWCVFWNTGLEKPSTTVAAARRMVAIAGRSILNEKVDREVGVLVIEVYNSRVKYKEDCRRQLSIAGLCSWVF